jgi:hypothetical protein
MPCAIMHFEMPIRTQHLAVSMHPTNPKTPKIHTSQNSHIIGTKSVVSCCKTFAHRISAPYFNHKVSKKHLKICIPQVATYMLHALRIDHENCQHECLRMIASTMYSVLNSERAFTCPFLSWYPQHSVIFSRKDASIHHSLDGSYRKQFTSMHLPALVMARRTPRVLYDDPVADCHVLQKVVFPWITAFCPPD